MKTVCKLYVMTAVAASAICGAAFLPAFAAGDSNPPDFTKGGFGWASMGGQNGRIGNDFIPVAGSPDPVTYDLARPYVPNNEFRP